MVIVTRTPLPATEEDQTARYDDDESFTKAQEKFLESCIVPGMEPIEIVRLLKECATEEGAQRAKERTERRIKRELYWKNCRERRTARR